MTLKLNKKVNSVNNVYFNPLISKSKQRVSKLNFLLFLDQNKVKIQIWDQIKWWILPCVAKSSQKSIKIWQFFIFESCLGPFGPNQNKESASILSPLFSTIFSPGLVGHHFYWDLTESGMRWCTEYWTIHALDSSHVVGNFSVALLINWTTREGKQAKRRRTAVGRQGPVQHNFLHA